MLTDIQFVRVPRHLGDRPVVAHVVQGHRGNETTGHECLRWGLHVERVPVGIHGRQRQAVDYGKALLSSLQLRPQGRLDDSHWVFRLQQ